MQKINVTYRVFLAVAAALILGTGMGTMTVQAQGTGIYQNDPRLNEKAMEDIVVNPDAVYGFSPDPNSDRLGTYATYDWTDPEVVEKAKIERIQYHLEMQTMYDLWNTLEAEGKSVEEIARAVSAKRNQIRLDSYKDDPEGLAKVKESNLKKYGNEEGPTVESLYAKYGSWETVLLKSFSENTGMDACLGLYDLYYPNYEKLGAISGNGEYTIYTVVNGDCLYAIARKYYGYGYKAASIAKQNGIEDPNWITVGQKLKMTYNY